MAEELRMIQLVITMKITLPTSALQCNHGITRYAPPPVITLHKPPLVTIAIHSRDPGKAI